MDDGLIITLSIVGGIIVIICNAIIANQFNVISRAKGYNTNEYFWFCFLFGIAGWLMVVALPQYNKNVKKRIEEYEKDDDEAQHYNIFLKRRMDSYEQDQLTNNESDNDEESNSNNNSKTKICPYCKQLNHISNTYCAKCDAPFPTEE